MLVGMLKATSVADKLLVCSGRRLCALAGRSLRPGRGALRCSGGARARRDMGYVRQDHRGLSRLNPIQLKPIPLTSIPLPFFLPIPVKEVGSGLDEMNATVDYYAILGVLPSAEFIVIRAAYSGQFPRKIAANTRRSVGPASIAGFDRPTLFALSNIDVNKS